ncbi:hypothetical protein AALO_G00001460 [Alosa alosa]|uniref:SH3 domain-containing protein n=2 Tax=Alosa alosa TaxID=278164 RepID=A0AAV6HDA3_9TELE|nr:hypothetical protein AALO_G00001460 [Alosa alosa]
MCRVCITGSGPYASGEKEHSLGCSRTAQDQYSVQDAVRLTLTALPQLTVGRTWPNPPRTAQGQDLRETALHLAVRMADRSSLALVDFLTQNSGCLEKRTVEGNTALHYCALHNKTECLKLLLKGKAVLTTGVRLQHTHCIELLELAHSGKFNSQIHVEYTWEMPQELMYDSEDDLDERVNPHSRGGLRSPLPPNGHSPNSPSRWNFSSTSVANKTYENVDFLYCNPPANSAPTGTMPPPLPAKSIQRGRSDPQISVSVMEGANIPMRLSSSQRHGTPSPRADPQPVVRMQRPPHGGGVRAQRQTMSWDGQPPNGAASMATTEPKSTSPQNHLGPISSEKTTSYRRTSSGGQGKGGVPSCAGSQEELYCSLVTSVQPGTPTPTPTPTATAPICLPPPPRTRRNAMVSQIKPRLKKVRALVDCRAVSSDQLAFFKDEVIIVTATDDPHWWVGHIDGDASRSGIFPVNYVHKLGEWSTRDS